MTVHKWTGRQQEEGGGREWSGDGEQEMSPPVHLCIVHSNGRGGGKRGGGGSVTGGHDSARLDRGGPAKRKEGEWRGGRGGVMNVHKWTEKGGEEEEETGNDLIYVGQRNWGEQ